MKNTFRDFFRFNKRERNGVIVFLGIIGILLLYLNISAVFVEKEVVDFSKFDSAVNALNASLEKIEAVDDNPVKKETNGTIAKSEESKIEHFNFNPNGLSVSDWKKLGLTEKQIKTIKKYESKGGVFKKKEDLKKIYGITAEQYFDLEPYIQIYSVSIENKEDKDITLVFKNGKVENSSTPAKHKNQQIDLNTADSITLLSIKGIGPFFAKSIIKYRNQLGGFVAKEQLMEIWKMDKEKYETIENDVAVDVSIVRKIKINSCSLDELKHPYLKWNQINGIINYRQKHGKFKTIDEIRNTDLVDEETIRKIAPYLIIE